MPIGEQLQMMRRARDDIKQLRAQIAQLQPKADAYDKLSVVLDLLPRVNRDISSQDIAWMLDKRIRELEAVDMAVDTITSTQQP